MWIRAVYPTMVMYEDDTTTMSEPWSSFLVAVVAWVQAGGLAAHCRRGGEVSRRTRTQTASHGACLSVLVALSSKAALLWSPPKSHWLAALSLTLSAASLSLSIEQQCA